MQTLRNSANAALTIHDLVAYGADPGQGYSTEGSVLASQSADGINLNAIWEEAAAAMALWNKQRSALASIISYPVTVPGDAIPQSLGGDTFDIASEFGEPTGLAAEPDALIVAYRLDDYDKATRFSHRFIRSASADQIKSVINRAFEADNRLVTGTLLRRLFDPTQGQNEFCSSVYGLYNADGVVPPPFAGQTFAGSTTQYLVSGNAALDPGDLRDAINAVRRHGFGVDGNSRLLVLCNPAEAEIISTFKAGEETNGVESAYDFVPSASAPAYLTPENIVGLVAPGEFGGLEISGSFGPAWIAPSHYIPIGYVAVVATGGPNSSLNPVAFREHPSPEYRGLRQIAGRDQRYPLIESYFLRTFGTGVRLRGAACIVQVKASGSYTKPEWSWS